VQVLGLAAVAEDVVLKKTPAVETSGTSRWRFWAL
jgi:hypothetical protein